MAIEKAKDKNRGIYFCTITCYRWLPLIEKANMYNHIYNAFKIWREQDVFIVGFVIMPNHMHFITYIKDIGINLAKLGGNFKRFMAYDIVKRLKADKEYELLGILQSGVKSSEKNKKHQVFKASFDTKECYTNEFILQKLNYIHANPVIGKWKLVDDYREYPHSSAGYYENGKKHEVEILSYLEI